MSDGVILSDLIGYHSLGLKEAQAECGTYRVLYVRLLSR